MAERSGTLSPAPRGWARACALLALLGWGSGCAGQDDAQGPANVVLICLDTVRADHVGCYGYEQRSTTPAIDRLAGRSTVFLDTSATAGWTKPSVPSFLTGTYPLQHGVYRGSSKDENGVTSDVLPERATTLAEVFSENGYATAAFVKNAQLRRGLGFEQGFDVYRDEAGDAREIRWRASDWLEERDPDQPFFLYLHFLDAHWPYAVPDEYAALFAGEEQVARFRGQDWRKLRDDINHGRTDLAPDEHEALLALYDGSIRYIDDQLGRFFATLERLGVDDDTIVCILSDHGEEFLEHGRIGHGHGLYENLLSVPWILHVPGRNPERWSVPCSLVDLFPTLLSAAGLAAPGVTEGVDRLRIPEVSRAVYAEHLEPGSYQQAWRADRRKLTHTLTLEKPERSSAEGLALVRRGTRWEARVELASGSLRAVRLRARGEDPADPTEIKGPIAEGVEGGWRINGIDVDAGPTTELYGDGAERGFVAGAMAKARGSFTAEGRFVAAKIKLYPEGQELEREIRGVVGEVAGGRIDLGGIWLEVDDHVDLEQELERPKFDRERVAGLLGSDPEAWAGIRSEARVHDLEADSAETAPGPAQPAMRSQLLDFCRGLLGRRVWSQADSASLSEADLQRLRAIGYAE